MPGIEDADDVFGNLNEKAIAAIYHLLADAGKSGIGAGHNGLKKLYDRAMEFLPGIDGDATKEEYAMAWAANQVGLIQPDIQLTGEQFNLDFTTVKWDKTGELLAGHLETIGVPFERAYSKDGAMVRFTFDKAYCPNVSELSHALCDARIRGLDERRFWNIAELDRAAAQMSPMTGVREFSLDENRATIMRQALNRANVPYGERTNAKTGEVRIVAKESDLADMRPYFAAAEKNPPRDFLTKEQIEERMDEIHANVSPEQVKELQKSREKLGKTKPHEAMTPVKDRTAAKKSAEAQKRAHTQQQVKNQKRSK